MLAHALCPWMSATRTAKAACRIFPRFEPGIAHTGPAQTVAEVIPPHRRSLTKSPAHHHAMLCALLTCPTITSPNAQTSPTPTTSTCSHMTIVGWAKAKGTRQKGGSPQRNAQRFRRVNSESVRNVLGGFGMIYGSACGSCYLSTWEEDLLVRKWRHALAEASSRAVELHCFASIYVWVCMAMSGKTQMSVN